MAVSAAEVTGGVKSSIWDVIATLDADVGPQVITHNFNTLIPFVVITPLLAAGALGQWAVTAFAANTITLTKANVVGSGNAGAQIRVFILPYQFAALVPGR